MDRSAETVLNYMKEVIESNLDELNGHEEDEFCYGGKTAYVECLEIIQEWEGAKRVGLDYNVEERYPL